MKRRIILLILSIIIVLIILSTTTYALFYRKDKLANTEDYATGYIDIVIDNDEEGLGDSLTLSNALPISDSDGRESIPYRFKITNRGNLDYEFDLTLTRSGTLNGSYIKITVDDNEPITLTNTTTVVASNLVLFAGESMILNVRVWLSENTPNSEIGKTFTGILNGSGRGQVFPTVADKVISLAGNCTSWESGFSGVCATSAYEDNGVTKYHEYRYVGANVDNWVRFNDDDYRIIGVFDDNSHGVEGEYLIKLISADKLMAASWGAYNSVSSNYTTYSNRKNDWTGSVTGVPASANVLLNEFFLNPTATSTYGECINWTYYTNSDDYKTKDCSIINRYGIQTSDLRNYIEPVTWYLKGYDDNSYSKQNFYTCERSDATIIENCNSGNSGDYATKVANKSVGLIYVSDYLYASGYYSSADTQQGNQYYYGHQNWLYNGDEWTITPVGNGDIQVFYVSAQSYVYYNGATAAYAIRPTFYLKSSIKMKSGTGSYDNPYVIGV